MHHRSARRRTSWSPTPSSSIFDGCGLSDGHPFSAVILGEYDSTSPWPRATQTTAWRTRRFPVRSQLVRRHLLHRRRGTVAACSASGSASFISLLGADGAIQPIVVLGAIPGVTDVPSQRAMENVYSRLGWAAPPGMCQLSSNSVDVYAAHGRGHRRRSPTRLKAAAIRRPGHGTSPAVSTPLAAPRPGTIDRRG